MLRKNSKQRDAIVAMVKSSKSHPSADEVYGAVRKIYPQISLGTVYRNLSALAEAGGITRITCGLGGDRFDGNTAMHYHFQCAECKRVFDVEMAVDERLNKHAAALLNADIDNHTAMFYGRCAECKNIRRG